MGSGLGLGFRVRVRVGGRGWASPREGARQGGCAVPVEGCRAVLVRFVEDGVEEEDLRRAGLRW